MEKRVNYQENQWGIDVPSCRKELLRPTFGSIFISTITILFSTRFGIKKYIFKIFFCYSVSIPLKKWLPKSAINFTFHKPVFTPSFSDNDY
jgi:hypothetical protein